MFVSWVDWGVQWPNHQLFQRDRDSKKVIARYGDGWPSEFLGYNHEPEEWEYSEEDQIDESAWSFWPEHDTWNTGWDESYWDNTSLWNCVPQHLTDSSLDLSICNSRWLCGWFTSGRVRRRRCASNHVGHEQRSAHIHCSSGLLNRVRNSRGYHPVVGVAVSPTIENGGKN